MQQHDIGAMWRRGELAMPYLLVRHRVAAYSRWKPVFDSHSAAHQASGLRITHVTRSAEDPTEVVLLFEADDLRKAREFVAGPDVSEAKTQAGVLGEPEINFLT